MLANARVLVVDDHLPTAKQMCLRLAPFVEFAMSALPCNALSVFRDELPPLDLLLTDLRFLPDEKKEFCAPTPRHGIDLLRQLEADCPPSVVMTGSVSSRTVANLASHSVGDDGTPAVRFVLKSAGIGPLKAQLEGALRDSQNLSPEERARIVATLPEPSLDTANRFERDNTVALVQQTLTGYLEQFSETIALLKTQADLESWPCWRKLAPVILEEIRFLGMFNSESLLKSTSHALHQITGRLLLLDPSVLEPPTTLEGGKRARGQKILEDLFAQYQSSHELISETFAGFKQEANGRFSLDAELREIFSPRVIRTENPIYYYRQDRKGAVKIADPDGEVHKLLKSLNELVKDRSAAVEIRYCDGVYKLEYLDERRTKLNWGDGFRVNITIHDGGEKPAWEILDGLKYSIQELAKRGVLYCNLQEFTPDPKRQNEFTFFIKANNFDQEAEAQTAKLRATILVTESAPANVRKSSYSVSQVILPNHSFTAIGFDARELHVSGHKACATRHGDKFIIAAGSPHLNASLAIYSYLTRVNGLSSEEARILAASSLRMEHAYETCLIEHERHAWTPDFVKLLEALGLKVRTGEKGDFPSRVALTGDYLHGL